ncbi:MAG TPA: VIT1/CCC1 family protein [Anaerohalosphaeraceae bacterium]|nr:VIT1/CCC1 family protein [Anaerohalosphaeraceae bacterium]HRT49326.1 VIT1/CCC1 family protein [Anaerohalosphaeraceae bacterium]HRT85945.1 VIT1/CCC1 family protein [Anaerohalosphaeraceae bacterium]
MKHAVSREQLLDAQRNEASEYETYSWLASRVRDESNRAILERIAGEERRHYEVFKRLTGTDVGPRRSRVFWYRTLSRGLGLSFGLRLMERGERLTQSVYARLKEQYPQLADVLLDEQRHETEILGLIEEERIAYAGSVVLGLNDALVELTGALAGLTLALRNGQVIAMTGLITGVAASMSMAASAFLSSREEADRQEGRSPLKSAAYTGAAYIATVIVLILPYLLISSVFWALAVMMALSILVILSYNFYIATAKGTPLWRRFGTMAGISLAVAVISFLFGMAARTIFGVDV